MYSLTADINKYIEPHINHLLNSIKVNSVSNPISLGIVPVKELSSARFKTRKTITKQSIQIDIYI